MTAFHKFFGVLVGGRKEGGKWGIFVQPKICHSDKLTLMQELDSISLSAFYYFNCPPLILSLQFNLNANILSTD